MNWERRIPPFAEDALFVLNEVIGRADDESLPKDEVDTVGQKYANIERPKTLDRNWIFQLRFRDSSVRQYEAILVDDDRYTETDAEHALDVLQSRGHIYYVNERVYITPTDS